MGSFGKYHLFLCLALFLVKFPVAFHQMAIMFLSPNVEYTCADTENQTTPCPCANPVYDKTLFENTIIIEWDLICNKRWLNSFTQTLFQLGTLLGSVFFGMASDRLIQYFFLYCIYFTICTYLQKLISLCIFKVWKKKPAFSGRRDPSGSRHRRSIHA